MAGKIDTTGLIVESYEKGMEHLSLYPLDARWSPGYYYAMLMEEKDGRYRVVERNGMPCWGALREYETGTRPDDPWPDDLRTARHKFPKTGKPVAVAACFNRYFKPTPDPTSNIFKSTPSWQMNSFKWESWNKFIDFVYDKQLSPWRKALKDVDLLKNKDGIYWGAVFKDTNIDANIMVGLLRTTSFATSHAINFTQYMADHPDVDPRAAFLLAGRIDDYNMAQRVDLKAWLTGEPEDFSSGATFYERESYNRPDISYLFGGKGNKGTPWGQITREMLDQELAAL